jgi:hypothetical protein
MAAAVRMQTTNLKPVVRKPLRERGRDCEKSFGMKDSTEYR